MDAKRTYVSPLRLETAARTREEILRAATELFAERGYARVTVADIAQVAGVSPKTVFASAGSKSKLLNQIVDQAVIASGYEAVTAHLLTLTRPAAIMTALAHGTRFGNEQQFAVHEAIRKALPVHEDGEALWERATAAYREALAVIAKHLHGLEPARSRPAGELADLLWLWFGPNAWRTLVVDAGWSWERAEEALRRTASAHLWR